MKTIVGIDAQGEYQPAIELLARLRFPKMTTTLLHVANPSVPYTDQGMVDPIAQAEFTKVITNAGIRALDRAKDEACTRDVNAKTKLVYGSTTHGLTHEAEDTNADLIAVNATHHGFWSNSFMGSVSRGLAIGAPCTALIAKGKATASGKVHALFATDHSEFANRCLERFLELHPEGISTIEVVSAYMLDNAEIDDLNRHLPLFDGDADGWIRKSIETANDAVAARLHAAGYGVRTHLIKGRPNDAIRHVMQETQAELAIVGAHGKGFFARALIGSTSLHQVVAEPYPVLVVRPFA
jgi:nucleotide-binding universal stress UspA family protein